MYYFLNLHWESVPLLEITIFKASIELLEFLLGFINFECVDTNHTNSRSAQWRRKDLMHPSVSDPSDGLFMIAANFVNAKFNDAKRYKFEHGKISKCFCVSTQNTLNAKGCRMSGAAFISIIITITYRQVTFLCVLGMQLILHHINPKSAI